MFEKAVVTGASGFIGSALVTHLMSRGTNVLALGRSQHPPQYLPRDVRWLRADVRSPGVLNGHLDEKTCVFHLAGHTSVAGSVSDPLMDFDHNLFASMQVLESVRHSGARVLLPSSPAVFASGQALPLSETASKRPTSPYGAAKLACEGYAQSYHACYGVDVCIARIFNAYGPGMTKFAIYDFWKKIRQNPRRIELLGDGAQLRDYLYIDDVIKALVAIAERGVSGQDYNVGSGIPVKTLELARTVATLMGSPDIEISVLGKSFPGDIPQWYADVRRLSAISRHKPRELLDGLELTLTSFDEQQ